MSNFLKNQTSPYLLQHAENPVNWYPWGAEAFRRAKTEDKPIFLSIGYSTCHWCHVMAHESFEDQEIAEILNRHFISVKVDKEERPDIDSIYMTVCQAFTGSGGWPTSIFMTPSQKPFFAGTYFPKAARYGTPGLKELLLLIQEKWQNDRQALLRSAEEITAALRREAGNPHPQQETSSPEPQQEQRNPEPQQEQHNPEPQQEQHNPEPQQEQHNPEPQQKQRKSPAQELTSAGALLRQALTLYTESFDASWGGFGSAPKFPAPHNLLFLLQQYRKHDDKKALEMAERTLQSMYVGGMFDHIGYGFCRYSTDRFYLVPHFEKMLYDNALLILAYCHAYDATKTSLYREVAEKTASYILREMTSPEGGFYSAQDADSDGEEGKFYVFTPEELLQLLGEKDGAAFNEYYGITPEGNFEGKSIPNLLHASLPGLSEPVSLSGSAGSSTGAHTAADSFDRFLPQLRAYRKSRTDLHLDDKILTYWNSLMIAALCALYQSSGLALYLEAAEKACRFLEEHLCREDRLHVSFRKGRLGEKGFLEDYAGFCFALLALYDVTCRKAYLRRAQELAQTAISLFYDEGQGGFYLYGNENEQLLFRPKECYDGALPSGNSLMVFNLLRLHFLCPDDKMTEILQKQLLWCFNQASSYPPGYAMYLVALSDYLEPPAIVTVVLPGKECEGTDAADQANAGTNQERANADRTNRESSSLLSQLPLRVPSGTLIRILEETPEYRLQNGQTTYYVCRNHSCLPPTNELPQLE